MSDRWHSVEEFVARLGVSKGIAGKGLLMCDFDHDGCADGMCSKAAARPPAHRLGRHRKFRKVEIDTQGKASDAPENGEGR
jgi:hypothetical protein